MNPNYLLKHWLTTLVLAPLLPIVYEFFFNAIKIQGLGLLEIFPIALMFSLLFSTPTFILYYFIFLYLIKRKVHAILTKIILISLTIIGIVTTVLIIGGSLSETFIFSYSLASIITGVIIRIKTQAEKTKILQVSDTPELVEFY